MKHIFIVNPRAGSGVSAEAIENELKGLDVDWEIYVTAGEKDATRYVSERCKAGERIRFYACGGDGTINEVASGVVGHENASMSCYPVGSGNDFVKYFGGRERFLDIKQLCAGEEMPIDLIRVDDRYCVNICHFGFDTEVARTMSRVKSKKLIGGKNAYTTGVAKALISNMKTRGRVCADGETIADGAYLLCSVANGQYVGGMFKCAPRADISDGLLEVCLAKPVSRLKFLRLVGSYKDGKHLDDPRFSDMLVYRRCRRVEVFAQPGFGVSLDGEIYETTHFTAEVMPGAIRFAVPGVKAKLNI